MDDLNKFQGQRQVFVYRSVYQALGDRRLPEASSRQLPVRLSVVRLRVIRQDRQVSERPVPDGEGRHRESREGCVVEGSCDAI